MSEWKAKRFWKKAHVSESQDGFGILLDTRPVKTPAKSALIVPSRALAEAIAAEWDAQEEKINPQAMPMTRSANAAIDKVRVQQAEVATLLAEYADSDLLCYRAESPKGLVAKQAEAWDPLLDWAAERYGARLVPVSGVMHTAQNPDALARLSQKVHRMDVFALTAFHDLVGLSGSMIIGLAALDNLRPAPDLWQLSRVDELWQEDQWGIDEEAHKVALLKESEFLHAKTFHDLAASMS